MSEEIAGKGSKLPFVMTPKWESQLSVLLGLLLGVIGVVGFVFYLTNNSINLHDFHVIGFLALVTVFILIYFPMLFICLGKVCCDENEIRISILGITWSKISWASIRQVRYDETANVQTGQKRFLIYHDGSCLGFPTWINNFMYRKEDVAVFLSLLHKMTTKVKFSGFSNK